MNKYNYIYIYISINNSVIVVIYFNTTNIIIKNKKFTDWFFLESKK